VYVFDHQRMFIGSMNLDPRSLELNSEMGVIVKSAEMATDFEEPLKKSFKTEAYRVSFKEGTDDLEWTTQVGDQVQRYDSEPEVGVWKKSTSLFYSLFVPESLL
jgi:putative cardiolipin synthase